MEIFAHDEPPPLRRDGDWDSIKNIQLPFHHFHRYSVNVQPINMSDYAFVPGGSLKFKGGGDK